MKICSVLTIYFLTAILVSCSKKEPVIVTVTDDGFIPVDTSAPNSKDEKYTTTFAAGSTIGVFAVRNGKLVDGIKNLHLIATDDGNGNLIWKDENGNLPVFPLDDTRYFACYPFTNFPDVAHKAKTEATDAATFFESIIKNWECYEDQGTNKYYTRSDLGRSLYADNVISTSYDDYTRSNLMVASAVPSGTSLTFNMEHPMALAVIKLPTIEYALSNDKSYTWLSEPSGLQFDSFGPRSMSVGTYRYLVHPSSIPSLTGKYTDTDKTEKEWRLTDVDKIPPGHYKVYTVDQASVTKQIHPLKTGDFFLADGSLVDRNSILTETQKSACIGIVLKAGRDTSGRWKDDCRYKLKDGKTEMNTVHGYILSNHEMIEADSRWGSPGTKVDHKDMNREQDTGFYGYKNTQAIKSFAGNADLAETFPAIYHTIVSYEKKYPAPATSSGWFLPSAGQCFYLCKKGNTILPSIEAAGGDNWDSTNYWSSSECGSNPAEKVRIFDFYVNECTDNEKDGSNVFIRPFLAF